MSAMQAQFDRGPVQHNIVIVDDHPSIWDALRFHIARRPDLRFLDAYVDGNQLLGSTSLSDCDILILDLLLPGMDGLDVATRVRRSHPEVKILIFTMDESDSAYSKCRKAGVDAYIGKRNDPARVLEGIDYLLRGQTAFYRPGAGMMVGNRAMPNNNQFRDLWLKLQPAGRDALAAKIKYPSWSHTQIAQKLPYTKHTVSKQLSNIQKECRARAIEPRDVFYKGAKVGEYNSLE